MKFSETFLDELRARVPVSDIVGRKFKLRKVGHEFRAVDDKSLTVNDQKGLWWDHAKNEGGDAFEFLTKIEGLTFPEAVKTCASIAGLPVPTAGINGSQPSAAAPSSAGDGHPPWGDDPGPADYSAANKIAKTYDYTDETGVLIYQVVRYEPKEFRQRRPDGKGGWVWSIKDIHHLFYRLPELREALGEERVVFITEGEKDADTLWGWGVPATTNSGGAQHWGRQDLSLFKDAQVIVTIDNDAAGRSRGDTIGIFLKGIAKGGR